MVDGTYIHPHNAESVGDEFHPQTRAVGIPYKAV